ncbi:hypothetical protein RRG08_065627 [Elysia crispata]|uniref:Uncharacterized protein n=1 Tax=Elysia crispata TaxID=231223 RepID=A0AAE0YN33_9GAST|nr:hypothetical protein RRG08_065627 [Elysia crispata]
MPWFFNRQAPTIEGSGPTVPACLDVWSSGPGLNHRFGSGTRTERDRGLLPGLATVATGASVFASIRFPRELLPLLPLLPGPVPDELPAR